MTNVFTVTIGAVLVAAFMGFLLVWVPAPPLIIICVGVFVLFLFDAINAIRTGRTS